MGNNMRKGLEKLLAVNFQNATSCNNVILKKAGVVTTYVARQRDTVLVAWISE